MLQRLFVVVVVVVVDTGGRLVFIIPDVPGSSKDIK